MDQSGIRAALARCIEYLAKRDCDPEGVAALDAGRTAMKREADRLEMRQRCDWLEIEEGLWKTTLAIGGADFHAYAVEVVPVGPGELQEARRGGQHLLDGMVGIDAPDSPWETIRLPSQGLAEFVLVITPYAT